MRVDMALGQYLDVAGLAHEPDGARRVAWLKGGAYTVEGPLLIGAAFADGGDAQRAALHAFGRPLGEAFQLRDDLVDGEAALGHGRRSGRGPGSAGEGRVGSAHRSMPGRSPRSTRWRRW